MLLSQLLERIKYTAHGSPIENVQIDAIQQDSRLVKEGTLFIAVRGTAADGHLYIDKAITCGAKAIVCETLPDHLEESVSYLQVKDSHLALAMIASAWNGYPSEEITLVGVTGTNGKTTIASLLYKLFTSLGYPCGLLSTVCNYVIDRAIPATHTTPDPLMLNDLLRQMVDAGCEYAFMEVSSHAADQKRIGGLDFDGGIFTNLTRDHMDYHKTVDNYLKSKKTFFDLLPAKAFALSNADDKTGPVMLQNTKARKRFYSIRTLSDYTAKIVEEQFEGMELQFGIQGKNLPSVITHFVGRFNASNLAAVFGAALELGVNSEELLIKISNLYPVNGRFEAIRSPKGFCVIVDYAHTPDALINVLDSIHEIKNKEGRILTVVGCGGNRDKGKRPIMALEAALRSDHLVLTSDNPRYEDPDEILKDMQAGLNDKPDLANKTLTITDRRTAIRTAILMAQKGDIILIAGKGHEDYQDIQGVKHHFDDHEVAKEAMGLPTE